MIKYAFKTYESKVLQKIRIHTQQERWASYINNMRQYRGVKNGIESSVLTFSIDSSVSVYFSSVCLISVRQQLRMSFSGDFCNSSDQIIII